MKIGHGIRVFVSGPYTAPTRREVEENVWTAIRAMHRLMDHGFAPLVPHLAHYAELRRPRPYEQWMALCFAWIPQAQAMFRLPSESPGADREVELARAIGIPVFESEDALLVWASTQQAARRPEHVSSALSRGLAKVAAGEG